MSQQYLTVKDVSKMLQISEVTIFKLMREGKLPRGFLLGGSRRWDEQEIRNYLKEQAR